MGAVPMAGTLTMKRYKIIKEGKGGNTRKVLAIPSDTNYSEVSFQADGHKWTLRGCWFWMAGLSDETIERRVWAEYDKSCGVSN